MSDDELCECVLEHDWDDNTEECLAEYIGDSVMQGIKCSRPSGHDGPHAACTHNRHPIMSWGWDDTDEEVPADA